MAVKMVPRKSSTSTTTVVPGLQATTLGLWVQDTAPPSTHAWWRSFQPSCAFIAPEDVAARQWLGQVFAHGSPAAGPKRTATLTPDVLALPAAQCPVRHSVTHAFFSDDLPEVLLTHVAPGHEAQFAQQLARLAETLGHMGYWLPAGQPVQLAFPKLLVVSPASVVKRCHRELLSQLQLLRLPASCGGQLPQQLCAQLIQLEPSGWLPRAPITLHAQDTAVARSIQPVFHRLCWESRVKPL